MSRVQCRQQAQPSAAAHMDCCPHADAVNQGKLVDEIKDLGQLLGYSTVNEIRARGVVQLRAESRAALAKAQGRA